MFKKKIYLIIIVIFFIHISCEKDDNANENWSAGTDWIDTRDEKQYKTVQIGNQVWMAENLAYLPSVNDIVNGSEDEGSESDPFYYVYDYHGTDVTNAKATSNYQTYGVLYNWTASLNSCPDGWHIPSDDEWKELEIYLGMNQDQAESTGLRGTDEGEKLKAISGWEYDGNGTNESGFTALPGGNRLGEHYRDTVYYDYMFANSGVLGASWSTTEVIGEENRFVWSRHLQFSDDKVIRGHWHKSLAISIRCVKD